MNRESQSAKKGRKVEQKQRWQTMRCEKERDGERCSLGQRSFHFPSINIFCLGYTKFYWHGVTKIPGSSCNLRQMLISFRASVLYLQTGYNDSTYLANFENKVLSGSNSWYFRRGCKVIGQQVSGFLKVFRGIVLESYMFISYDSLVSNRNLSWLKQTAVIEWMLKQRWMLNISGLKGKLSS